MSGEPAASRPRTGARAGRRADATGRGRSASGTASRFKRRAISAPDSPSDASSRTRTTDSALIARGRPSWTPCAFRSASAARVRSAITRRSHSATEAMTFATRPPAGVVMSRGYEGWRLACPPRVHRRTVEGVWEAVALDATHPLRARVLAALDARPQIGLLYPSDQGGYLSLHDWRRDEWYPALEAAGLPKLPPYAMRHTFASFAIAAGVSLFYLARLMGSSVEQIDRTYGHLLPDSEDYLRGLLDVFDRSVSERVVDVGN